MRTRIAWLLVEYFYFWEQHGLASWATANRYRAERYHHPEVFSKVTW